MASTGRFKAYRSADAELTEPGYLKAWISLKADFDTLNEPVLSGSPVIGEKYTIGTSHAWLEDKEAIPVYIDKKSLEATGDTQGDIAPRLVWAPKLFIIGDGASILEMVTNWLSEELIVFYQDQCNPAKFIQFGCDCQPVTIPKAAFSSGTLNSGKKGYELTAESYCKYFYNGTIAERA